jgi:hypothetical protein
MASGSSPEGTISDPKILEEIFARPASLASATFFNDLPGYFNVFIVQVGCKFIYDDGHNDNKGANVNIKPEGGTHTLVASHNGCCRSYIIVAKAKHKTNGQEWNLADTATVEQGFCGGNFKWHLIADSKVAKGSGSLPFRLVLRDS